MSISTASPVKRPFKYEPRGKEIFEIWFEENISLDASNTVELACLHEAYQKYVVEHTGTVPLKKNKFSTLLRDHLSDEIGQMKVRAYSRTKVFFEGLNIKGFKTIGSEIIKTSNHPLGG